MISRAVPVSSAAVYRSTLAVGLGGALGANARYLLGREVTERWSGAFPWGTLLVNVTGCVALGVLVGWLLTGNDRPMVRLFLATGILGGYTTFSTFAYEMVRLLEDGSVLLGIAYGVASLALCLCGAGVGMRLGKRL